MNCRTAPSCFDATAVSRVNVRAVRLLLHAILVALALASDPGIAAGLRPVTEAAIHEHPGLSGVMLVDSGAQALRHRDALVAAATQSIDAQYYIWNSDASGRYLAARLLVAADRGVRVRILLDDINISGRDAVLARLAAHPNVQIRIYNPSAGRQGILRLLGFIRDFSQINRRMHNKSFTVDGVVSIVGGRNVGDEYFDLDPEMNFRDRELLAVGPVVDEVTQGFEAFWNSTWTRPAESLASPDSGTDSGTGVADLMQSSTAQVTALGYRPPEDLAGQFQAETLPALIWAPARVVFDRPPTPEQVTDSDEEQLVARELRQLVAAAREEILAESAYLILVGDSLDEAKRLHAAGVQMRALTNSLASNDLVTNHSGYARNRPAMLEAGIDLYELRPDAAACQRLIELSRACDEGPAFSLHSKSIVVDRRVVYVGSFNLNLRSTYLNSETALIVESPELGAQVAASIDELLRPDSSWRVLRNADGSLEWWTEIDGEEVRSTHEPMAGRWKRFTSRVYRLFPLEKYL